MSEPRQPADPTEPSSAYPPNTDPAYSAYPGQYWAPEYGTAYANPAAGAPMTQPSQPSQPTQQFPTYWQPGMGYPTAAPPPPPPPKSPRWLWIAAAAAVLLVTGLVVALVIVSNASRESTVVAPPTPPTNPQTLPRLTPVPLPPTVRPPLPTATANPQPTATGGPGAPATQAPTASETVVYRVTGEGRAINITYVDTDGVMQTEFNVALPWSKEVSLAAPAKNSASVAVVNVGRDVTCSVAVNGAQVRQRTGRGLTICTGVG